MEFSRLTGHQIFEILSDKDLNWQWGGNDQPSIYLVTAILEQLPVNYIAGGFETMQVMMLRDLTTAEQFMLSMLNPDSFNRDGWTYTFWWD